MFTIINNEKTIFIHFIFLYFFVLIFLIYCKFKEHFYIKYTGYDIFKKVKKKSRYKRNKAYKGIYIQKSRIFITKKKMYENYECNCGVKKKTFSKTIM